MRIANLRQAFDQRNLCPLGPRKFRTQANSESRSILFEHGGSSIYSILLSTWQSNLIILVIDFSLGRHPCLCQPLIRLLHHVAIVQYAPFQIPCHEWPELSHKTSGCAPQYLTPLPDFLNTELVLEP